MSRSELPPGFGREQQNMYYTRIYKYICIYKYIWYFVMNTNARRYFKATQDTLHTAHGTISSLALNWPKVFKKYKYFMFFE